MLRARGIFSGIFTSVELCEQLLEETGVALLPGRDFGHPAEELTTRLAFVAFDGGRALDAARRISLSEPLDEEYLSSWCGDTLEAVARICDWLDV